MVFLFSEDVLSVVLIELQPSGSRAARQTVRLESVFFKLQFSVSATDWAQNSPWMLTPQRWLFLGQIPYMSM